MFSGELLKSVVNNLWKFVFRVVQKGLQIILKAVDTTGLWQLPVVSSVFKSQMVKKGWVQSTKVSNGKKGEYFWSDFDLSDQYKLDTHWKEEKIGYGVTKAMPN